MTVRPYAIIEAPSTLGLSTDGVEQLPERLLELGLAERIGARRAARLAVPAKDPTPDNETRTLNAEAMALWSPKLADAVETVLDAGEFPLLLGGDCTIVLGSMLALRRRGRYGLLFIDGNADFFQPEAEPNGEGDSMDLAFVTGHGPELVTNIEGRRPIVRAEDVVAFGFRDHEDQVEYGSQPLPPEMLVCDLPTVDRLGVEKAARLAIDHLSRPELEGYFIHLDADVLDDAIMPAVDFRVPGGLSADDVAVVLRIALSSGTAVGLEVTIYNPALDPEASAGRILTQILVSALRPEAGASRG
jgi:arginase